MPKNRLNPTFRFGFLISPAIKVTPFQASLEKTEPTIAAEIAEIIVVPTIEDHKLVSLSKDCNAKAFSQLAFQISEFAAKAKPKIIKPNKDKKLDKEWQEIDTIAKSAWSIKLGEAIDTESPKSKQFIQDLAEGMNDIMKDFEKLWKESNPKSVNDFEKLWKESNNDFDGIYGHYYTQQSVHPLGDYTGTCITIQ